MLASLVTKLGNRLFSKAFRNRWKLGPRIRPQVLRSERRDIYVAAPRRTRGELGYPGFAPAKPRPLCSSLCTAADLASPAFQYWFARLAEANALHRKLWEYGYICQALYERGKLQPGSRGLAFAVGREQLPALFTALGCNIVATDLAADDARAADWGATGQWSSNIAELNVRGLCSPEEFARRVTFRPADMNNIPADLTDFDFTWSSCSFEHCGSLQLGADFVANQMRCLKPGGVAVHTTEFNLSSNTFTQRRGSTVVFRRCDIERLIDRLRADGHEVEPLDLSLGEDEADRIVDLPPYSLPHLRLALGPRAVTSIGLIVRKS